MWPLDKNRTWGKNRFLNLNQLEAIYNGQWVGLFVAMETQTSHTAPPFHRMGNATGGESIITCRQQSIIVDTSLYFVKLHEFYNRNKYTALVSNTASRGWVYTSLYDLWNNRLFPFSFAVRSLQVLCECSFLLPFGLHSGWNRLNFTSGMESILHTDYTSWDKFWDDIIFQEIHIVLLSL